MSGGGGGDREEDPDDEGEEEELEDEEEEEEEDVEEELNFDDEFHQVRVRMLSVPESIVISSMYPSLLSYF